MVWRAVARQYCLWLRHCPWLPDTIAMVGIYSVLHRFIRFHLAALHDHGHYKHSIGFERSVAFPGRIYASGTAHWCLAVQGFLDDSGW